jgi:sensor histidine kinase YesM
MDSTSSGVGIKNTDKRLRSTYGAGAGLRIRSSEAGYSVSFFIPLSEEERDFIREPELRSEAV